MQKKGGGPHFIWNLSSSPLMAELFSLMKMSVCSTSFKLIATISLQDLPLAPLEIRKHFQGPCEGITSKQKVQETRS